MVVYILILCIYTQSYFEAPWTIARQALLSMGFPRQEYWGGLPFPSPGDLQNPGMEPMSPASPALRGRFLTTVPPGEPVLILVDAQNLPRLPFSYL